VTAELTTYEREDGQTQVAANGWPLYYFANDETPGDTNGQGVGDVWWVLDPAGMPIREDGGLPDDVIDPSETITLEAPSSSEWTGLSPSSIEGETDPTLRLAAGEEYEMEWANGTTVPPPASKSRRTTTQSVTVLLPTRSVPKATRSPSPRPRRWTSTSVSPTIRSPCEGPSKCLQR